MGFCLHRGAKLIAEFNDAWAEKLKKIKFPQHRFSSIFHKKKVIYLKNIWVTEHLRELNPSIDIKMPTGATYLYMSSTVRALNA